MEHITLNIVCREDKRLLDISHYICHQSFEVSNDGNKNYYFLEVDLE
jgi:hypothetical protein